MRVLGIRKLDKLSAICLVTLIPLSLHDVVEFKWLDGDNKQVI